MRQHNIWCVYVCSVWRGMPDCSPEEGVLRIFSPLKIPRLRPGLNPRTWVLKASTLTPRPPKPLYFYFWITNKEAKCVWM